MLLFVSDAGGVRAATLGIELSGKCLSLLDIISFVSFHLLFLGISAMEDFEERQKNLVDLSVEQIMAMTIPERGTIFTQLGMAPSPHFRTLKERPDYWDLHWEGRKNNEATETATNSILKAQNACKVTSFNRRYAPIHAFLVKMVAKWLHGLCYTGAGTNCSLSIENWDLALETVKRLEGFSTITPPAEELKEEETEPITPVEELREPITPDVQLFRTLFVDETLALYSSTVTKLAALNDDMVKFVRENVLDNPAYVKPKLLQFAKQREAGALSYGQPFQYATHNFVWSEISELFDPMLAVAKGVTKLDYDIVFLKVYQDDCKLARHQDVGGGNMEVACFTFATDVSHLRSLEFFDGGAKQSNGNWSGKVVERFTPEIGSMWVLGGTANSKTSHRVKPPTAIVSKDGFRVSVSLRRSTDQPAV